MDNSQESNPKYPVNNPDPAKIAYRYKAIIVNKDMWDTKVNDVKFLLERLEKSVKELQSFTFTVGVEHEHT